MRLAHPIALFLLGLLLTGAPASAQDAVQIPRSVESALMPSADVSIAQLRLRLRSLRLAQVETIADAWVDELQRKAILLSEVEAQALSASPEQEESYKEEARGLREQRDALIDRLKVILADIRLKGGDPAPYERYISAVSSFDTPIEDTAADDRTAAERALATPVDDLRLQLVPLRLSALEQEAERWLGLLEDTVRTLSQAEIALRGATDEQTQERLRERVAEVRAQRSAIIDRVNAVLSEIRSKGGDTESYERYVAAVTSSRVGAGGASEKSEADRAIEKPIDRLRLEITPYTKEELIDEADFWKSLLQGKTKALSRTEAELNYPSQELTAEERSELVSRATRLRDERDRLIARMNVVLKQLKRRGGEVEPYEQYIASVKTINVDATDPSQVLLFLRDWITSDTEGGGIWWAKRFAIFAVIMAIAWVAARIVGMLVRQGVKRIKRSSALLRDFLVMISTQVVLIIGFVLALGNAGFEVGPLLAALGAAGFVLAFALQGTLSNIASGVMILMNRPFDVGDVVEVAGVSGIVDAMNLVSTTIATYDNQVIVVPNNSIWGNVITNLTGRKTRRVDLKFGISYAQDVDRARAVLEEVVTAHPTVLKDPPPNIRLHEFGDSSVNLIVRPWVNTADYWDTYWDLMKAVKERFDAEGIAIPFPQRDVHLYYENAPIAIAEPKEGLGTGKKS